MEQIPIMTLRLVVCKDTLVSIVYNPHVLYSLLQYIFISCTGGVRLQWRLKRARGLPVTVTAFKWLCPSVLPEVSGQLVAPCKTPLTALP